MTPPCPKCGTCERVEAGADLGKCRECRRRRKQRYKAEGKCRGDTRGQYARHYVPRPRKPPQPQKRTLASALCVGARARARKLGIPFAITPDCIHIPDVCPVLGVPLARTHGLGRQGPNSPTLDRIRPELGYVPGNVVVVSWRANEIKRNSTVDELALVLAYYRCAAAGIPL